MEYSQEKAIEIATKFGLNKKTVQVWKYRSSIPNRYLDGVPEELVPSKQITSLIRVLETKKLNLSELSRNGRTVLGAAKLHDLLRGKSKSVGQKEYSNIKFRINELRVIIKKFITKLENQPDYEKQKELIISFFRENREIVVMKAIEDKKIIDLRCGCKARLYPDEVQNLVYKLSVLALELQME